MSRVLHAIWQVISAPFRGVRWCWRKVSIQGLQKVALLSVVVMMAVSIFSVDILLSNQAKNHKIIVATAQTTKDTNELVGFVRNLQSPAYIAKQTANQQAAITAIVGAVDCKFRTDFKAVLDGLVNQGYITRQNANLILTECSTVTGSTTTTTTVPHP